MTGTVAARSWTYPLGTRIAVGFVALFIFGMALFIVSIPALAGANDHSADWIVYLTGAIMLSLGMFAAFATIAMVRTFVRLDDGTLEALVPAHHTWFLAPEFQQVSIPLTTIRSVERRDEIVRTLGMSTLRQSLSVVTTDGRRVGLVSGAPQSAPSLPIDEIAAGIAASAGLPVTDDGTVRSKAPGLYGAASSAWTEKALDPPAASAARRAAYRTVQIASALLLMTLILRACL